MYIVPIYMYACLLSFAAERGPNEPELGRARRFSRVLSSLHEIKVFLDPHSYILLPLILSLLL